MPAPLYINHDSEADWLIALEFGRVFDGQPDEYRMSIGDDFSFVLDEPGGRIVGMMVSNFSSFDADGADVEAIWRGPRFDAPTLGLSGVPAGEVIVAARATLGGQDTINRMYFNDAVTHTGKEAAGLWLACLEAGDCMAHFGLGYTLVEIGELRLAYRHLRTYAELVPWNGWAWCWLGRACEELGDEGEALTAYEKAVAIERRGGAETDAPRLLAALKSGTPLSAASRAESDAGGEEQD